MEGFTADNYSVGWWQLYYGIGENPADWQSARKPILKTNIFGAGSTEKTIGAWDVTRLTGLPETDFALKLKVWDLTGNLYCATTHFEMNRLPRLSISADKWLFSPNGDGVLDEVGISYTTDEPVTLDLQVSKDGQPMRELVAELAHPGGMQTLVWNGKDDAGSVVPDGRYTIMANATDACGNAIQKKLPWYKRVLSRSFMP